MICIVWFIEAISFESRIKRHCFEVLPKNRMGMIMDNVLADVCASIIYIVWMKTDSGKVSAREKDEILNKIPIFLAKTYRMVDVRLNPLRTQTTKISLAGIPKVTPSLSKTSRGSPLRSSPNTSNTTISSPLSGNWICMDFINLSQAPKTKEQCFIMNFSNAMTCSSLNI